MRLLLIDTETTGLEADASVIEVAAAIYNTDLKEVSQCFSTLLPLSDEELTQITAETRQEIEEITGIDPAWCSNDLYLERYQVFLSALMTMEKMSNFVMAHNASFDKKFFDDIRLPRLSLPWIDSMNIEFPNKRKSRQSLTDLAICHKIPVIRAHRALADVLLLAELLKTTDDTTIREAAKPRHLVVSRESYADRQKPKDAGFIWNSLVERKWAKLVTDNEIKKLTLKYEVIQRDVDGLMA